MELTKTKTKYKQTEIGLIPEDWEVVKLKEKLVESPKYGIGAAAVDFNFNLPTYLRITDIEDDGTLRKDNLKSVDNIDSDNYYLNKNDLVFARTGASVGKSYLYDPKDGLLVYAGFLIKVTPICDSLNSKFLRAFVSSKTYWNWVGVMSMRSGQPGINSNEFGNLPIPLPPLPEQKAIAQVLSDTDTLIQTLEQKLAKKRAIKQGAMQQLLTPKEDWEVRKLGDLIYSFQNGYGFSANGYVDSGIPIVTMAHIGLNGAFQYNESKMNFWQSKDFDILKSFHLKDGDLIIAMTDVTPNKNLIGRMAIVKSRKTLLLNQRVGLLRVDSSKLNSTYLKTYSNMEKWRNYCIGSASLGVQANIGTKDILNGLIELPSIEKQTRIATILSDMDAEIAQLEQKLDKYKLLKQGLMQELLTGRIRLL